MIEIGRTACLKHLVLSLRRSSGSQLRTRPWRKMDIYSFVKTRIYYVVTWFKFSPSYLFVFVVSSIKESHLNKY